MRFLNNLNNIFNFLLIIIFIYVKLKKEYNKKIKE